MPGHCPGAANLQTPPLTIRKSPQCGKEVGVFSTDGAVKCSRCRFVVYHDMESCIPSGSQAKECPGDGMYWNMTREKKRYFH